MAPRTQKQTHSVTEAILAVYDSGNTVPASIYSQLMFVFPMLSIATINNVIQAHRVKKMKEKKPEVEKPKSEIELLSEYLDQRCRRCPYYPGSARVCAYPESLCIYPDQKMEAERLKVLQAKKAKQVAEDREREAVLHGVNKKRAKAGRIASKRQQIDAFSDIEDELDALVSEPIQPKRQIDIRNYINVPTDVDSFIFDEEEDTYDEAAELQMQEEFREPTDEELESLFQKEFNAEAEEDLSFDFDDLEKELGEALDEDYLYDDF